MWEGRPQEGKPGGEGSHRLGLKIWDIVYPWAVGSLWGSVSTAVSAGAFSLTTCTLSVFLVAGAWWWWPTGPQSSTRRPTGPATTSRMSCFLVFPTLCPVFHAGEGSFPRDSLVPPSNPPWDFAGDPVGSDSVLLLWGVQVRSPGWGTKIAQAMWYSQQGGEKNKQK